MLGGCLEYDEDDDGWFDVVGDVDVTRAASE